MDRIIADPIHTIMSFNETLIKIMDTTQFQRLRYIKQLGGSYYVYPAADHSRFSHSLGVCYLARKLTESLRSHLGEPPCPNSPSIKIDDVDVLCVSIAGLVHDLGHGPFSHLWEDFLRRQNPSEGWKHEEQSIKMLRYLIDSNGLWPSLQQRGMTERDLVFIEELINPPKSLNANFPFRGRQPGKEFLYQIVSNPVSGIDVDKFDYIERDSKSLDLGDTFKCARYLEMARVVEDPSVSWNVDGPRKRQPKLFVGMRDKDDHRMASLFRTRQDLHRRAYQHKTTKIIEAWLIDIFCLVDDEEILPIRGSNGRVYRLSTAHRDPEAFVTLTNEILGEIRRLDPDKVPADKRLRLQEAQGKIRSLETRDLPKCVHVIKFNPCQHEEWLRPDEPAWKRTLPRYAKEPLSFTSDDVRFVVTKFDYGAGQNDPVKNVRFYDKMNEVACSSMRSISFTFPVDLAEQQIFVYATRPEVRTLVREAAIKWEETLVKTWTTPKACKIMKISEDGTSTAVGDLTPPTTSPVRGDDGVTGQPEVGCDGFLGPVTPPHSQETRRSLSFLEDDSSMTGASGSVSQMMLDADDIEDVQ